MAPTMHTVLGERAAEVDDVRLEPGGQPKRLTDDQVQRLADAGVELEKVDVPEADLAPEQKPLAALRKPEAVALAEERGVDASGTLDEIVARLEEHATAQADEDGDR